MPTTPVPILYRHNAFSDWGMGTILMERDGKLTIAFENAGTKVFPVAALSKFFEPAKLDAAEAAALDEKLRGRRAASAAVKGKSGKKATGTKVSAATFPTFEAQLKVFESLFPGGFQTEKFIAEERGVPGVTGKAGYKEYGIALVNEELSAARFSSASPEELFDTAKRALQVTNIAHPLEAAIPFRAIADADRPLLVAALRELLHGEGDYGARLEAFVKSVNLKDKQGKPKRVTWPLATLLPALFRPDDHVPVKPTIFASQSTMLGDPLAASQPVTGPAYERFRQVALKTRDLLVQAGQAPRDLMDVYSFIYRTHDEQPK